jgi:hypothetical protein
METTEQQTQTGDDSRRTMIIVVAVVAAVAIAGIFYFLLRATGSGSRPPEIAGMMRAGAPEFEQNKSKIILDNVEAFESPRGLGDIVMEFRAVVRNFSGKTINALEVKAAVVDYEGKPVKERIAVVIPTQYPELGPNKTAQVRISLDGISPDAARSNIKMEMAGVKFK